MGESASSRYNTRAWGFAPEAAVGTNRLIAEITMQGGGPKERVLFPPRLGYNRNSPGIEDCLDVDNVYEMPRDTFYTGGPASIGSSSTPSLSNTLGNS